MQSQGYKQMSAIFLTEKMRDHMKQQRDVLNKMLGNGTVGELNLDIEELRAFVKLNADCSRAVVDVLKVCNELAELEKERVKNTPDALS